MVREAAWRTLELRHYDVQLVGAMALRLGEARVLLAPVRFGAGIKTKVLDAFWHGTPVVLSLIHI